jgi:hypothetical protein
LIEADAMLMEGPAWHEVFSSSIQKALRQEYYTPVKVIGWIGSITDPIPITPRNAIQESQLNLRGLEIKIVDSDRSELKTLIAPVAGFDIDLYELKKQNHRIIFCGAIVPVDTKRGPETRLFLWKVFPSYTAEDLIGVDEEDDPATLRRSYEKAGNRPYGVFNYIRRELIDRSGIKGVNEFPELGKCIDVMIYQAFSDGMNDAPRYSNKIHTLVIGPPGIGKKFLVDIARALNPVFNQATSVGGKISVAGLVGTAVGTRSTGNTRISQPGYLPLSSGGVLALSDFHQLKGNRETVLAALSEAMEDGIATDSTIARTRHQAETSLHLDLNRTVDVNPSRTVDTYSDVNIPYNIISRFDFIIDLPGDLERRLKPIEEAFSERTVLSSSRGREQGPRWQRELQRLVADMRSQWRKVGIPREVNEYALERVKREFGLVEGHITTLDQRVLESNIPRTARSVHKFIKAIACANHSLTATREDVDRAFDFIREKITFLSTYREDNVSPIDPRKRHIQDRSEKILAAFGNREFTTGQVIDLLAPAANAEERKTIRQQVNRDLARLVSDGRLESVRQGRWKLMSGSDRAEEPKKEKAVKRRTPARKTQPVNGRRRRRSS